MAAASSKNTFDSICNDIRKRNFAPIYLLMGDESYFIDKITDLLSATVLTEEEKDFNLSVFYGTDSEVNNIIASARRYPMMSEYQLIIIKEAQQLSNIELLDVYAKNLVKSTILVINYKYGSLDKRKSLYKAIDKVGTVFESKKLYESNVPAFITDYFRNKEIAIDMKSAQMLTDFVGNDLSKLVPQLQKLEISILEAPEKKITSELIEKNVGISKDYNNFELQKAIINKDVVTANRIIDYFEQNPKDNPIIVTIVVLFNYFSNLLECYWLPQRSEQAVMNALNLRSTFFVKDYMTGLRNYNVGKVMEIISLLRTYDAKSKGIDNASASNGDLLRELIFRIMH